MGWRSPFLTFYPYLTVLSSGNGGKYYRPEVWGIAGNGSNWQGGTTSTLLTRRPQVRVTVQCRNDFELMSRRYSVSGPRSDVAARSEPTVCPVRTTRIPATVISTVPAVASTVPAAIAVVRISIPAFVLVVVTQLLPLFPLVLPKLPAVAIIVTLISLMVLQRVLFVMVMPRGMFILVVELLGIQRASAELWFRFCCLTFRSQSISLFAFLSTESRRCGQETTGIRSRTLGVLECDREGGLRILFLCEWLARVYRRNRCTDGAALLSDQACTSDCATALPVSPFSSVWRRASYRVRSQAVARAYGDLRGHSKLPLVVKSPWCRGKLPRA
jgi:hypothetical protein